MTRRRNIVPLGGGQADPELDAEDNSLPPSSEEREAEWLPAGEVWDEEGPSRSSAAVSAWLIPTVAMLLLVGWTAYFLFAHAAMLTPATPPDKWSDLVVQWSMPAVLVVALWLLAMRHSRAEATRFADVAASLRAESHTLEERLGKVNAELSLAREFLTAQGRDLESLGRMASERLTDHAGRLEALVGENSLRVDKLHGVSGAALENMEKLRGQLPVATNAAKDLTNAIGQAGENARAQLDRMREGFERVGETGDASAVKVDAMGERVNRAIDEFTRCADQLGALAADRFAALDAEGAALRERLDQQEIAALAAVRTRAEQLEATLDEVRARLDDTEHRALSTLRDRLGALESDSSSFAQRLLDGERSALDAWRERIAAIGSEAASIFGTVESTSSEALESAGARIAALSNEISRIHGDLRRQNESAGEQIAQRMAETENAANALSERMRAAVAQLDSEITERRLRHVQEGQSLAEEMSSHLANLDSEISDRRQRHAREGQSLAEELSRQLANLDTEIAARRDRHGEAGRALAESFAAELAAIDEQIADRRQRHEAASAALGRHAEGIAAQLAEYGERMQSVADHGREAESTVASSLSALAERLAASREALSGTDRAIADLTDNAVRLLELIEASAKHSREALPSAVADAEGRLEGMSDRIESLRALLGETGANGEALDNAINATRQTTSAALAELEQLHDRLQARGADHAEQLGEIRETLSQARSDSEAMARAAEETLNGAIARLAEASREAVRNIEGTSSEAVRSIAEQLAEESGTVVQKALRESTRNALENLDGAVERATEAAREAAGELRDELARVEEITGHLEHRIAAARQRAEDDIDEHFAKRVSQITESLNSTAIDIDKVLSAEVSDAAWQAYLKGERGIFTRRAVRLIDSGEAREIIDHYEADTDFREHVNRYIHDFEAMLRNLLATREGNAVAVTMLSSDMGKLYVALAQSIERLRR